MRHRGVWIERAVDGLRGPVAAAMIPPVPDVVIALTLILAVALLND